MWLLVLISICILWAIFSWIYKTISNSKKYLEIKPEFDSFKSQTSEFEIKKREAYNKLQEEHRKNLDYLAQQKDNFEIEKQEVYTKRQEEKLKIEEAIALKTQRLTETIATVKSDLEKIAKQKSMGFPWLAKAYADYKLTQITSL